MRPWHEAGKTQLRRIKKRVRSIFKPPPQRSHRQLMSSGSWSRFWACLQIGDPVVHPMISVLRIYSILILLVSLYDCMVWYMSCRVVEKPSQLLSLQADVFGGEIRGWQQGVGESTDTSCEGVSHNETTFNIKQWNGYSLGWGQPSQDSSNKWRFRLETPTNKKIRGILVVFEGILGILGLGCRNPKL